MLELKQITKEYRTGEDVVHALKGINLQFRTAEFVAVLGPSGCGKTTLLNIIGGLDKYTSGDLVIDGISTKNYKDRDWDNYRNHSIGFVFQSYNLIPHQTVLSNVELALTLSGVAKAERRKRAENALQQVGLGNQFRKKPNQMSGGQMQRVAIARALVNNPDIILADEPTGALDTETGIQVMELLKQVSNDRLVVMVTHNPDLAEKYASRIIRILDGEVISDSAPLTADEIAAEHAAERQRAENATSAEQSGKKSPRKRKKRASMSFWTAFRLSLNNLFTKKGRTILTSFAGSIGIIGIALILAVSQGTTNYIDLVEQQTLTSYPLVIESTAMDLNAMVSNMMNMQQDKPTHGNDKVYKRSMIYDIVNMVSGSAQKSNDLQSFKQYLEKEVADENSPLHDAIAGLQYTYNLDINAYTKNVDGEVIESDVGNLMRQLLQVYLENVESSTGQYYASLGTFNMNIWQEMLPGNDGALVNDLIKEQYEFVDDNGHWPEKYNEVVLVMNADNEISDIALYALGLIGQDYVDAVADAIKNNNPVQDIGKYSDWSYEDIYNTELKIIPNSAFYSLNEAGKWQDNHDNETLIPALYDNDEIAIPLKICGIVRPNPDATNTMLTGTIGYTTALAEYLVEQAEQSQIVKDQMLNQENDVLTGLPFNLPLSNDKKKERFVDIFNEMESEEKMVAYSEIYCLANPAEVQQRMQMYMKLVFGDPTAPDYSANLREKIAQMTAENMGVSVEVIQGFIDKMSDEQLLQMIMPRMTEMAADSLRAEKYANVSGMPEQERNALYDQYIANGDVEQVAAYYDEILEFSESTLQGNLTKFGIVDFDKPTAVYIYASSFDAKEVIADGIENYNNDPARTEDEKITYTDLVALVMNAVTTIVNAVTYVLIAFVAISLIVSSIMIGVITLISVQERTKEIGILRAIGASKRDVSSMFNAETVIIGFAAGAFGVLLTYLLCLPINAILRYFTHISTLRAFLPPVAALILVAISMLLTVFSGLIPARSAAKKDPVVALRTE